MGKTLGQTTSDTSLYDSDFNDGEGKWMINSVIDTNDGSGEQFLYNLKRIGNLAAGYIAASKGLPWALARIAFDSYQSKQNRNIEKEGLSTRNAERYGYEMVKRGIPGISRIPSLWI
ncbi:MAG: hypothetical protein K2H72_06610, partial [Muribaculaceae bacterium]|nr:hypothetical protein [Muribaculaceae bacterium]